MAELEVEIINLPAMRVASFRAVGENPERAAFEALSAWMGESGLLGDMERNMVFGFDVPQPVARGYEFWVKVPKDVQTEDTEFKEVPAGTYAVTPCRTRGDPGNTIPSTWMRLDGWSKEHGYSMADAQCLERHHAPVGGDDFTLDLYYPVKV